MHGANATGLSVEVLDHARHALVLLFGVTEPAEAAEAPAVSALLGIDGNLQAIVKLVTDNGDGV